VLKNGKAIYILWWDYFHLSYPLTEKKIVLPVESRNQFRLTEAVPHYERGIDVHDYETAFTTSILQSENGALTVALGKTPVFLEEVEHYDKSWITVSSISIFECVHFLSFITSFFIVKKLQNSVDNSTP
jgi:hypothetical protein